MDPERASIIYFKEAAIPGFSHGGVVFDLFIESRFCI